MRAHAPPISELRLQRIQRWMLLWLKWFAAFLTKAEAIAPFSRQARAIAHRWLNQIERVLTCVVAIRAAPHVRVTNAPKHATRPRTEHQLLRAVIGSAMRRSLRARDLRQRITALSQNVDALVARLLKRLPRGLTRRRPIRPRPERRAGAARPMALGLATLSPDSS